MYCGIISTLRGLALLADLVLRPKLVETKLDVIRNILDIENDMTDENPHKGVVHERIHEAAYGATSPMGHFQQAPRERIPNPTAQVVRDYIMDKCLRVRGWSTNALWIGAPNVCESSASPPTEYVDGKVVLNRPESTMLYIYDICCIGL